MGWDQGAKWLKENAAAGERVDHAKCVTSTYRGETWGLDGNWALMRCIKPKLFRTYYGPNRRSHVMTF